MMQAVQLSSAVVEGHRHISSIRREIHRINNKRAFSLSREILKDGQVVNDGKCTNRMALSLLPEYIAISSELA